MQMEEIRSTAESAVRELLEQAHMKPGEIFVVGCSSSEILGNRIGKGSSPEAAAAVFEGIYPVLKERGIFLAAQCCEHLNRALILERAAAEKYGYEPVNVCPWEHGGGSFATVCFQRFNEPVAVEHIRAHAGMDIGDTLIGMHLRDVAVPVRISFKRIGQASLVCARTRAKFIGGERARYLGADLR
ncbi:MAG: TIGR01440 family protein [Oscillospiraceae bacterium]|nr:TIGR01440 family protein [Oscillospiraceae bacterium]